MFKFCVLVLAVLLLTIPVVTTVAQAMPKDVEPIVYSTCEMARLSGLVFYQLACLFEICWNAGLDIGDYL